MVNRSPIVQRSGNFMPSHFSALAARLFGCIIRIQGVATKAIVLTEPTGSASKFGHSLGPWRPSSQSDEL